MLPPMIEFMVDELLAAHRYHDADEMLDAAVCLTKEDADHIRQHPDRRNYIGG
jgi:hypothetical protein